MSPSVDTIAEAFRTSGCGDATSGSVRGGRGPDHDQFGYTKADRRQRSMDARVMGLQGRAVSSEAHSFVRALLSDVLPTERPTSRLKLTVAAEAIVADLLVASRAGQWTRRALSAAAFNGQAVTRTMFAKVRSTLESRSFLDVIPGYYERDGAIASGRQTLFRPTPAFVEIAAAHGVTLDGLPDHFTVERPDPPNSKALLVLRAARPPKVDGVKRNASDMAIAEQDQQAARIIAELEDLNAFLASVPIEGFAFPGLRRIFNNGDQPGFRWHWGGRFYSVAGGDDYMRWKGGKAARADAMRLQGERVEEVDLSASHLTVLYGLLGEPFDHTTDPYAIEGQPRDRVKRWLTYALGTGSTAPREGQWYAKVREAVLERHPVLKGLHGHGFSTLDLQFHEAEVVKAAMRDLRDLDGVASLPVFDSLVVPSSKADLARDRLRDAFTGHFAAIRPGEGLIVPKVH